MAGHKCTLFAGAHWPGKHTGNGSLTGGAASLSDVNVSLGKTVTLAGATLTGSAAANYSLS